MKPCEGCDGSGVRDNAEPSCKLIPDEGWHIVERCDACKQFESDYQAAQAHYMVLDERSCLNGGWHTLVRSNSRKQNRSS